VAAQAPATSLKARSGRPYTILGVVLALVGFGVVVLFGVLTGGSHSNAPAGQADVVVAARDVPARAPLALGDVVVGKYATSDVPPSSFTNPADVKGLVPSVDIKKGQAITANLLVKDPDLVTGPQSAFLPIPSGFVALTIPTGEQQGVGGYIQAGDYISMIALVSAPKGVNVRTVFTNVHVLKVGPAQTTGAPAAAGTAKTGGISSSLTVIVTACTAEYLNWFIANAKLNYILASYKDYQPQDTSVDPTCPSVTSTGGVRQADVAARWPGIFT
jgi:Flp pilus assembly protein CpaB